MPWNGPADLRSTRRPRPVQTRPQRTSRLGGDDNTASAQTRAGAGFALIHCRHRPRTRGGGDCAVLPRALPTRGRLGHLQVAVSRLGGFPAGRTYSRRILGDSSFRTRVMVTETH